ncbi:hypothetical protein RSAG8_04992, partial [Rhizoctonia solani AG-8 WAC10335]
MGVYFCVNVTPARSDDLGSRSSHHQKMASRLGLRLAARSLRQPVALAPRTQAGRRAMSSAAPQQSSDAPWIAFAGIITVGGLAAIFAGGDSKPAHHESSPASKPKAPPKEEPKEESKKEEPPKKDEAPKGDDSKAAADNVEGSVSPAEVKESIERSIKADEPSTAKAEEAKSTGSPKKDSDSGSESGDDDFVKIEKISTKDTAAALAQSERMLPQLPNQLRKRRLVLNPGPSNHKNYCADEIQYIPLYCHTERSISTICARMHSRKKVTTLGLSCKCHVSSTA